MSDRPRISLCMIVRNEEKNLRACLAPVAPLMDEIIVVDTGSTDNTKTIAAELGARVFDFTWCDDFAAARNESLRRATGDWIFWLDADDRLDSVNVQRLRDLLATLGAEPRAYFMSCVCVPQASTDRTLVLSHCRLFRNHPDLRWERRVHEQIFPSIERAGHRVLVTDVEIRHIGYQDPTLFHRKGNRDLRLLRLEYATDPTDPVTLFNLGLTYQRLGQPHEALTYLLSSLKYATGRGEWLSRLYVSVCDALVRLGRSEEALAMTAQGLEKFPNDPVLMTRRADLLARAGDLGGAERCLVQLLRAPVETRCLTGEQTVLDRREAQFLLGMIYQDQGRWPESERVFQELLARNPTYVEGWVGLGYLYLAQQHFNNVEYVARQLEKCDHGPIYAAVLRSEAHVARGAFGPARELLDEAITQAPKMVWPRVVLAELLLSSGADLESCIATQRDVLRLDPGNIRAAQTLERLLRKQRGEPEPSPLWFTITAGS